MEPILNFGMKVLAFVIIIIYRYIKKEGCYQGIFSAGCWIFLFFFYKKKLIGLVCSVFLFELDWKTKLVCNFFFCVSEGLEELDRQDSHSPDCLLLSGGVFSNARFFFFFFWNTDGMAAAGAYHNLSPKNNNNNEKTPKQKSPSSKVSL